ncbi:MAG: L-serine ammonia-lyase, iron-sulfur-dependent, subunit alpha [Lachnospiraceae bacterium]|nr:L-serine ammonia-lyase, iron-sulfur-dependent, subunit alpha [Lachnospiraceae bacterium]
MRRNSKEYKSYIALLKKELIPAMGCTEPIALAYAAAYARETLGELPTHIHASVSGSIIKNVKSVIVPNTGHLKGIPAAIAAGVIAGHPDKKLEVLSELSEQNQKEIFHFLEQVDIEITHIEQGDPFDIILEEFSKNHSAKIRICGTHTNVVYLDKDEKPIINKKENQKKEESSSFTLTMESIWDFVESFEIEDVKELLDCEILYNTSISEEGLLGNYGANIGSVLLSQGKDIKSRAKAKAAAGSDARMNGCELPVVINSGSGNQGITCSVPVIEYAKELNSGKEKLYRALVLSNLISIHEKQGIGTLSAFCGAVSAGTGAGAGIAYLNGGDYEAVIHTVVNALAITSGIICDGAKASCAAKIAASVDAGILGYEMYQQGQEFKCGDGIVGKDADTTIKGVGIIGKYGMKETNDEIIKLMIS